MHAISAKELRAKLPLVSKELKNGASFLLIYNSVPIGTINPLRETSGDFIEIDKELDIIQDFQDAAAEEWGKLPPLTKKEHDYYMSLAPKKHKL